jgi:hypothetical protein
MTKLFQLSESCMRLLSAYSSLYAYLTFKFLFLYMIFSPEKIIDCGGNFQDKQVTCCMLCC